MDPTYDWIAQDTRTPTEEDNKSPGLAQEFDDAYKSFTASKWGSSIGQFVGSVRKQSELAYEQGQKELKEIIDKSKDLIVVEPEEEEEEGTAAEEKKEAGVVEGEGIFGFIRKQGARRLSELEKMEAQAEGYIDRVGLRVGQFLREAVAVEAPSSEKETLFEADSQTVPLTRLEKHLRILQTDHAALSTDPEMQDYAAWRSAFSSDASTNEISACLDSSPPLRQSMEALVPERVTYDAFWARYLFLQHQVVQKEEERKLLLRGRCGLWTLLMKGAQNSDTFAWDDEDEEKGKSIKAEDASGGSVETLMPPSGSAAPAPAPAVRSSRPSSESSYDVVSGNPSQAPSTTAETTKVGKYSRRD